jgi:nucleoside-diphosphate-sugar epimerase
VRLFVTGVGGYLGRAIAAAAPPDQVCAERGLRLVHLSSDAIFAGDLGRPLREDDPPSPITVYGATKAEAEAVVAAADPRAVLVRTSLTYGGAEPSNHERRALDPTATFYDDEIRCPVAAPDLAAAVIELAARAEVGGPLHDGLLKARLRGVRDVLGGTRRPGLEVSPRRGPG